MGFSTSGKTYSVKIATKFSANISFPLLQSSWFNLHVCFRVFWHTPNLEMPPLNRNKEILVSILVPKLQNLILIVKRRGVPLVHCIVPSVPLSPQNPKLFWVFILRRNIAPQKLMLPSSANFANKSFLAVTFFVNIKLPKRVYLSRQQMLISTIPQRT